MTASRIALSLMLFICAIDEIVCPTSAADGDAAGADEAAGGEVAGAAGVEVAEAAGGLLVAGGDAEDVVGAAGGGVRGSPLHPELSVVVRGGSPLHSELSVALRGSPHPELSVVVRVVVVLVVVADLSVFELRAATRAIPASSILLHVVFVPVVAFAYASATASSTALTAFPIDS